MCTCKGLLIYSSITQQGAFRFWRTYFILDSTFLSSQRGDTPSHLCTKALLSRRAIFCTPLARCRRSPRLFWDVAKLILARGSFANKQIRARVKLMFGCAPRDANQRGGKRANSRREAPRCKRWRCCRSS